MKVGTSFASENATHKVPRSGSGRAKAKCELDLGRPFAGIGFLDHLPARCVRVQEMRPSEPFRQKAAVAGISLVGKEEDVAGPRLRDGDTVHVPAKVLDEALSLRAAPIGRAVVVGEFERLRTRRW